MVIRTSEIRRKADFEVAVQDKREKKTRKFSVYVENEDITLEDLFQKIKNFIDGLKKGGKK